LNIVGQTEKNSEYNTEERIPVILSPIESSQAASSGDSWVRPVAVGREATKVKGTV
jgi:hypothetical protein